MSFETDQDEAFTTLHETSGQSLPKSNGQHPLQSTCDLDYAAERADLMFGCYRRGDANNAETYVTAISAVLIHYSPDVVKAVTDPYSGLPSRKKENGYSGMPDVADVKEACEHEARRLVRMAEYAKRPIVLKRLPRPAASPGDFANVLVGKDTPQYGRVLTMIEGADVRDWKWDDRGRGIWVSLNLLDSPIKRTGFKKLNPEPLPIEEVASTKIAPHDIRDEWVAAAE